MKGVSRETENKLRTYGVLIAKWNAKVNLVAASTLEYFDHRHIGDCVQVTDLCGEVSGHWIDLGSGGGLPGIVLAIVLEEQPIKFTLIESDKRKCVFLQAVVRELCLKNTDILAERIEAVSPRNADYISARALAPLPKLLGMVHKHMAPKGVAWLLKGRSWQSECNEARRNWAFDLAAFPSKTDPEAAVLKISGVSHA